MTDVNILPASDILTTGWTRNSGSSGFYTYVDDPIASPDDDTTYLYSGNQQSYDAIFGPESFNIPAGSTGISITVYFRMKGESSSNVHGAAAIKVSGTIYHGYNETLGTAYGNFSNNWSNNPATGNPWTVSEINALQGIGAYGNTSYNLWYRLTQVYAIISYTPPAAPVFSAPGGAIFVAGYGPMTMGG